MGNMDMLVKSAAERIAFSEMGFGEMRREGAAGRAAGKVRGRWAAVLRTDERPRLTLYLVGAAKIGKAGCAAA